MKTEVMKCGFVRAIVTALTVVTVFSLDVPTFNRRSPIFEVFRDSILTASVLLLILQKKCGCKSDFYFAM